jgi:hypothetical protein
MLTIDHELLQHETIDCTVRPQMTVLTLFTHLVIRAIYQQREQSCSRITVRVQSVPMFIPNTLHWIFFSGNQNIFLNFKNAFLLLLKIVISM